MHKCTCTLVHMIVPFVGLKGGVGKSTLLIHVAKLAQSQGLEVQIVDLDPQGSVSDWGASVGIHVQTRFRARPQKKDLILVDTPGRKLGPRSASVLEVADRIVLPVCPGELDFWALGQTLENVGRERVLVVLNRARSRERLTTAARAELEGLGLPFVEVRRRACLADFGRWTREAKAEIERVVQWLKN